MSFYPLLRVPGLEGAVTVHNFSPNNFETHAASRRHLYVCWSDGTRWTYRRLKYLEYGESQTVRDDAIRAFVPEESLPFVFITRHILPSSTLELAKVESPESSMPAWRGTISLKSSNQAISSYQGEIDPLPSSGTCLTFNYLQQPGKSTRTWLIALNIENCPLLRSADIEFYDPAQADKLLHREVMMSNSPNAFLLPKEIASNKNIVIVSKSGSFIPLFLSHVFEYRNMSLEHTHPPASSAMYGNRLQAQKIIKSKWFSALY